MGPKVLNVPILARTGVRRNGVYSWDARPCDSRKPREVRSQAPVSWPCLWLRPSSWSFFGTWAMDPIWSTVEHRWIWAEGRHLLRGARHQLLRLVSHHLCHLPVVRALSARPRDHARPALQLLAPGSAVLRGFRSRKHPPGHPDGRANIGYRCNRRTWKVSEIAGVCALVSIFTMGASLRWPGCGLENSVAGLTPSPSAKFAEKLKLRATIFNELEGSHWQFCQSTAIPQARRGLLSSSAGDSPTPRNSSTTRTSKRPLFSSTSRSMGVVARQSCPFWPRDDQDLQLRLGRLGRCGRYGS